MSFTTATDTPETDSPAKQMDVPFQIPQWFVEENVQIFQDVPPVIVSCVTSDNDSSESASGAATPSSSGPEEAQIDEELMEEIQDTIVGAMASPEKKDLSVQQAAVIIGVQGESPRKQEHIDLFVNKLARAMHAQLTTFDFGDLEILGSAFQMQEEDGNQIEGCSSDCKDCKNATRSPNPDEPFTQYFAAPSERKGSAHARSRGKKAIAALFQDFAVRKSQILTSTQHSSHTDDLKGATSDTGYRFIYVRDSARFLNITKGWRFFNRFREGIEEQRRAKDKVILLVAELEDTNTRLQQKLNVSPETKFWLNAPSTADEDTDYKSLINTRQNIRKLTTSIQKRFPRVTSAGQLPLSTAVWDNVLPKTATKQLGKSGLSQGEIDAIVLQILGKAAQKRMPEVNDIIAVLDRYTRRINKMNGESEPDDEKDESGEASKRLPLAKKLRKIRADGDRYEIDLLDCVIDPETLESTYDNVIIDPETMNTVRQLLAQSNLHAEGRSHFLLQTLRITGLLFYGPPGTGKTHLARAIAKESGLNLIALKTSDVQDKYVGEAEKRIHAAFTLATKLHPSILFIDEADAMFYRRGAEDKSWERTFLTQILQEMDGLVKSEKRPLVIVATNRPSDLDEAFLRRLPHRVNFGLPSEDSRAKILKVFLHEDDLDASVDIEGLARRTRGFSGSDLRSLCAQAALAWAVEQQPVSGATAVDSDGPAPTKLTLSLKHFEKAMLRTFPSVTTKTLRDTQDFARR